jgi:hypothetical protein
MGAMMTRHVRSRLKSVWGCEFLGKAERPGHVWVYKTGMQRYPLLPMTVELEPSATDDSSWGLNATQSLWRYVDAPAASTVGANKTGRRGLWSFAKPAQRDAFPGYLMCTRKDRRSSDRDQKWNSAPRHNASSHQIQRGAGRSLARFHPIWRLSCGLMGIFLFCQPPRGNKSFAR